MADARGIRVEVVAAWPERWFHAELALPDGSTVADAIAASGVRTAEPGVELCADRIGVFARKVTFATPLLDGDRVEIYRPLRIDPKEARRRRAEQSRT